MVLRLPLLQILFNRIKAKTRDYQRLKNLNILVVKRVGSNSLIHVVSVFSRTGVSLSSQVTPASADGVKTGKYWFVNFTVVGQTFTVKLS